MADANLSRWQPVRIRTADLERSTSVRSVLHPSRWRRRDLLLLPVAGFLIASIVLPIVIQLDPGKQVLEHRIAPPVWIGGTWENPIGTDGLGRDLAARVLIGARRSLGVGLIATVLCASIGVLAGLLAATGSRTIDAVLSLLAEVTLSLPLILVGIVITAMIGPSQTNVIVVMVVGGWIGFARVTRLQARQLRDADFVLASRSIGASSTWIAIRHMLPNLAPSIITLACQQVASVMLWEASLTYLGLGLPIDQVSLGGMIRDGQTQMFDAWWVSFMPGVMIAIAVASFALLGDWWREELEPVNRRRWRRRQGFQT